MTIKDDRLYETNFSVLKIIDKALESVTDNPSHYLLTWNQLKSSFSLWLSLSSDTESVTALVEPVLLSCWGWEDPEGEPIAKYIFYGKHAPTLNLCPSEISPKILPHLSNTTFWILFYTHAKSTKYVRYCSK